MVQCFVWTKTMMGSKLGKRGQGMVEYALILAFVVAIAVALTNSSGISNAISNTFGNVTTELNK